MNSADAQPGLVFQWAPAKMRRKPGAARVLGSPPLQKTKAHPAPALVDRKRHTVGSLARRVAAAAIGTAWGAAARVGHRDLRRASSGNVCSGDHDAKRVRNRVGCVGWRRSVYISYVAAV